MTISIFTLSVYLNIIFSLNNNNFKEFYNTKNIDEVFICHHKDFNVKNNNPENLLTFDSLNLYKIFIKSVLQLLILQKYNIDINHDYIKKYYDIIYENNTINKYNIFGPPKQVVGLNHKVVKVEVLEGLYDTGDITVEGHHNFALDAGIIVHNSNKAALSEENILFARTIISHQKYLTHQLEQLVQKVFDIINPEEALTLLDNVSIALPSPKSLQYEREARYLNEVANLVETLDRIGIPKAYTMKKYLTNIDWQELKNYEDGETIEKELGTKKDDELAGMGGGGGAGMGF